MNRLLWKCAAATITIIILVFDLAAPFRVVAMDLISEQAVGKPTFEVDASWPKPLPDKWAVGEIGGTCVDAQDHVFIVNRGNLTPREKEQAISAPPVIEFDSQGNVLNAWGNRDVLPNSIHGCFVDSEGDVWVAGNADAIVQKYSHDGSKLLLQIGSKGLFDTSDGTLTGAPLNSSHTLLNRPASIAVDPINGDIYVADGYGNRRVVVFDRTGRFLRQWGRQGTKAEVDAGVGSVFLEVVHCVVLGKDGLVYVCDRRADRVQIFDKSGRFLKSIFVAKGTGAHGGWLPGGDLEQTPDLWGSAFGVAFSPDATQEFMYVCDGGNEVVWILDRASGRVLSSFGRPGHQIGAFHFLHSIAVDSQGRVITGEVVGGRRVQRFRLVPAV